MGLFDFIKDIGNKLFNRDEEAAEKIKAHIEESNPGIQDLVVDFNNGVVSLTGNANSAEALEKAVLMAENVIGVTKIKADGLTAPPAVDNVEYYTIVSRDTLSKLAKKYCGDAGAYLRIFNASREAIKASDLIYVGQKIRIPMDSCNIFLVAGCC